MGTFPSRLPINTGELIPRVLSLRRWKTKAKMGSSVGSTGFSCPMAGHRLCPTLQMKRTGIRLRFAMRVRHIPRFLNPMTIWAPREKSECDNIQSTQDSHTAVTDMIDHVPKKYI